LSAAYASAVTPKVTVITGNAFGTAFTVLGSKALGTDICLALDSALISILPPDAAVQFVWGDKIAAASDSMDMAETLKCDWVENIASPLAAARCGAVDDVIAYSELRQRILAALGMLSAKCENAPRRRHSNLPL
jgi:propionyl-CoA carboxylase beta chain